MEYVTENLLKSTGNYRCPDDIRNFKIRIRIKQGSAVPNVKDDFKTFEFLWQEKRFKREMNYHNMICDESGENEDDFLFSYVNEENVSHENEITNCVNYLEQGIHNLNLAKPTEEEEYNYLTNVQKFIDNPLVENQEESMYIAADFGEYFEDTWLKNEKILCTLKYKGDSKVLQIHPDFTTTHPYTLKPHDGKETVFSYFIENASNSIPESMAANEKTLIKKIQDCQSSIKSQLISDAFKLPPKNKLYVFLFLEICTGKRFEYPEVYVQYSIRLPEGWSSESESLTGRTHLCKATKEDGLVHFGHCWDALLEYNFVSMNKPEPLLKAPNIYFEVISKDSWERYRTEGLCYINLPICQSGAFTYNANCFRFTTKSPFSEMKRFFIGDCQNYNDVTWIGVSDKYEETILNKYGTETITTGELNVRLSIIHQSHEFLEDRPETGLSRTRNIISERLGSSTLIKSVEQVIQEFKKARKEMLEVRKNV